VVGWRQNKRARSEPQPTRTLTKVLREQKFVGNEARGPEEPAYCSKFGHKDAGGTPKASAKRKTVLR